MNSNFLDRVYATRTVEDSIRLYDDWANSYDQELLRHGYATPGRCAAALASVVEDRDSPVLDYGCGTGWSGRELVKAGFKTVDGCDLSEGMMDVARSHNVYRKLTTIRLGQPLPFATGSYGHIAAVGVISVGAAPVSLMDDLVELLEPGGTLTFSYNDHTLDSPEYVGRVREHVDTSSVDLLFKEHGAHLPGIDLMSTVYVIQKR